MRMAFRVKYEDGREVEAVAKPKDVVAFERQYGVPFAAFATEGKPPSMEWLYYLAWSPLHRQGRDLSTFDAFLDVVDEIEPLEEEAPVDPFPTEASGEQSPD